MERNLEVALLSSEDIRCIQIDPNVNFAVVAIRRAIVSRAMGTDTLCRPTSSLEVDRDLSSA